MTTPADVISSARNLYNDADSALYRKSDTELLAYFNEGVKEMSVLLPAPWYTVGDVDCTPGEVEQMVLFEDAQTLVRVLCIHGGDALTPFDMAAMDAFYPGWRAATAGAARQWAAFPGDPLRFFLDRKAPAEQTVDVLYVRNPTTLTLTDTITEVPSGRIPALVDYVVYRAESADDEHALSQRATSHYASFVSKVKG